MVRMGRLWWGACASAIVSALAACGGGGSSGGSNQDLEIPAPPAVREVSDLVGPEGLCFDSQGNLYVGSSTGAITRIAPGGFRTIFAETRKQLAGLAAGPQDEIYAAAFQAGEVLAISQSGTIRVATSGLDSPNGIVFDSMQRAIVSAFGLGGDPQVAVIQPDGTYETLTSEIPSPNGLAFGPDGWLYVADTFMNRIVRLELDQFGNAVTQEVYASGIGLPDGIAFDREGDLFVAGSDRVWVVLAGGTLPLEPFVVSGDLDGPASLSFGFGSNRDPYQLFFTNFGFPTLGSGTTVASTFVTIPGLPLYAP